MERFIEEAQIGGQLQHPGIVPVYELGLMADLRPYFTMKLVKGRTLAALLAERGSPEESRGSLLDVFEAVCQTMAYAHSRSVIHRDLKPANIIVGPDGQPKVLDFGLAFVIAPGEEADLTHSGVAMGTPSYMAPEQWREAGRVGPAADIYSLGATLYYLLTGRPPHGPRASYHELYHHVMTEEPEPPRRPSRARSSTRRGCSASSRRSPRSTSTRASSRTRSRWWRPPVS